MLIFSFYISADVRAARPELKPVWRQKKKDGERAALVRLLPTVCPDPRTPNLASSAAGSPRNPAAQALHRVRPVVSVWEETSECFVPRPGVAAFVRRCPLAVDAAPSERRRHGTDLSWSSVPAGSQPR